MFLRTSLAIAALVVATSTAFVAPASAKTLTAQQQRMATCAKESTGKKGADHTAFMSSCLKGKSSSSTSLSSATTATKADVAAAATKSDVAATASKAEDAAKTTSKSTSQRAKMTDCNVQAKAKSLKGADRKSFMSSCLKA